MAPIHPLYIPQNTDPGSSLLSSFSVLRTLDNEIFLATEIPKNFTKDRGRDTVETPLTPCLIPHVSKSISLILNHPNIISLIDIQPSTFVSGSVSAAGTKADFTVWEDMNAGMLSYLLPSLDDMPDFTSEEGWHGLSAFDPCRFSLPESLCWHVLLSISKSLLWLHHGVKETEGIQDEWQPHDEDWHPVLIRDIGPYSIWFKKPKEGETYGICKLGGFQWAKVCGNADVAVAERQENADRERQFFWAPEIYKNTNLWSRASEIWSLGAVLYFMMTGIPPPRFYEYPWQISRMTDKGFSPYLREIVAAMLERRIEKRPDALTLVSNVQEGWRAWRANTDEGKKYVDVSDELLAANIERIKTWPDRVGAIASL